MGKIGYAAGLPPIPASVSTRRSTHWHTCPAGGEIRASNPCSEYMFIDDTACNLASLNLCSSATRRPSASTSTPMNNAVRPVDRGARNLGADGAIPSREIGQLSYDYRTLGLGYANSAVS